MRVLVCCAIALNAEQQGSGEHPFPSTHDSILSLLLRRLVRQLENHMYNRSRIDRLIVVLGRLEPDLVGSLDRGFVQAVTHAPHNAIHVQLPVCPKQYLQ